MVDITVSDGLVQFRVEGWDKLWSLKSELAIPLAHIRDVRADPTGSPPIVSLDQSCPHQHHEQDRNERSDRSKRTA